LPDFFISFPVQFICCCSLDQRVRSSVTVQAVQERFGVYSVIAKTMGRDKGKGRGGGGGRGSGKRMFIANIEELEMRNAQTEEHKEIRAKRREEEGAGGGKEESSSDEEEGEEKEKPKAKTEDATVFQRMSRAELAAKEGRAPAEEERPRGGAVSNNPNKPIQSEKMIKVKNVNATETPVDPDAGMNRKQR
ncbi:hypothetical protein B484DRAFT_160240, partial [Ochromonadaceae sp. CCMP2298]